jgi:hypothetical protein
MTRLRLPHLSYSESQALFEEIACGAYYDPVNIEGDRLASDLQVTVFFVYECPRRY